jgi:hypothetical protein
VQGAGLDVGFYRLSNMFAHRADGREVAGEFRASLTATLVKMTALNRFPMVIVCHGRTERPRFKRSDMIKYSWFPSKTLDPQSFAAVMLFNGAAE